MKAYADSQPVPMLHKGQRNRRATCQYCAQTFLIYLSESRRQFCSRLCYLRSIVRKNKTCPNCNQEFRPDDPLRTFCSLRCQHEYRWLKHRKPFPCHTCGKVCQCKPSDIRRFCSVQCYAAWKQHALKGQSNPNWKGGISLIPKTGRVGPGSRAYAKGQRLERKVREILRAAGYYVIRSGGSKGLWDLVAIGHHDVRLIQVKASGNPIGRADRQALVNFPVSSQVKKEIWRLPDRREPLIEVL